MNQTLSDQLDQIEAQLGKIGPGYGSQAFELLRQIDTASGRIRFLTEQGNPPKAEIAQLDAIQATLQKEASLLLREMGGAAALREERAKFHVKPEASWWFLDEYLARKKQAGMRQGLLSLGTIAGILIILTIVYQVFFKPDPSVIAGMQAEQDAQQAVAEGNIDQALQLVEKGLEIAVDDPDLLVLKGILLRLQGKEEGARAIEERVKSIIGNEELFYLYRTQALISIGYFELAVADAETAISINSNSAPGYLLKGQSLEQLGQLQQAYEAYQEASRLGELTQDDATTAQARILMGYLLQAMALPMGTDVTATITPIP
jgi:tetratricopeptide (TPR) repeat protein